MQKKVVWESGMLVEPAHFEMSERFISQEHQTQWRAFRGGSEFGLVKISWDRSALSEGRLELLNCVCVFPGGQVWEYDSLKDSVISLALERHSKAQFVYLQIDAQKSHEHCVSAEESLPYYCSLKPVIVLSELAKKQPCQLCVGRILNVDALGAHWDASFVAEVFVLQASPVLLADMKALVALFESRREALFGQLAQLSHANPMSLKQWHLWQVLNRHYPVLLSQLERRTRVTELYENLRALHFELSALLDPSLKPWAIEYDPEVLGSIFEEVFAELKTLLQRVWQQQSVRLSLVGLGSGYYLVKLVGLGGRLVLAIDSELGDQQVGQLLAHIKISTRANLHDLVKRQLMGLSFQLMSHAPAEMPFHESRTYFQLDCSGPVWREALKEGHLAIYWPDVFQSLDWSIWALNEEFSDELS